MMLRRAFALIGFIVLLSMPLGGAQAQSFDIDTCAPGYQEWDYTVKIVRCVENSVQQAVFAIMSALSGYMAPVLGAMLTFATAVFGMRMMGGEQDIGAKAMAFAIRAAIVMFFAVNLGGYASSVFAIETELINLVGGSSIWTTIDGFLGQLLGLGPPPLDISKGLIGIIGAGLLSSTPVGIMAFIALSAVINLLLFIFRVVFTYLTAIVMIGFLVAISPLVIPMALFVTHTERFFSKWLDILLSAMLTPVLLFAFLSAFLGGFSNIARDVITLLQCGSPPAAGCQITPDQLDFKVMQKTNLTSGSWLVPTDSTHATDLRNKAGNPEVGTAAVQTNIYPMARRAHQATNVVPKPGIDLGPGTAKVLQELIFSLLELWIFASFMKSLVERVPDLATNIAEASSYITMAPSAPEKSLEKGLRSFQTAITGRS